MGVLEGVTGISGGEVRKHEASLNISNSLEKISKMNTSLRARRHVNLWPPSWGASSALGLRRFLVGT